MLNKTTRTAMLLGVSVLLLLPVLAGCHDSQSDFNNMNRQQQINAMKPTANDMAIGKAMAEKMRGYNPGNTAPTANPKANGGTAVPKATGSGSSNP